MKKAGNKSRVMEGYFSWDYGFEAMTGMGVEMLRYNSL
jgi:hypothetical protein